MFINLEYFFNLFYQSLINRPWLEWWRAFDYGWRLAALVVIPPALIGIIYLTYWINELRKKEAAELNLATAPVAADEPVIDERWPRIEKSLTSNNPTDWRLAIIEADNILAEMLKKMNYPGETIGEQLKQVEPSDFVTLNDAWEAHKVRNRIVHNSQAMLARRETEETIKRYRRVFEEFNYL